MNNSSPTNNPFDQEGSQDKVRKLITIIGLVVVCIGFIVALVVFGLVNTYNNPTTLLKDLLATTQVSTTANVLLTSTPMQLSSSGAVPTVKTMQWSSPPPMTIDSTKQYFATVTMAKGGQFVIQLYADKAPITVNSFVFLAQQGFYNGVTFHRVLDGFMAQGGDPTGTGGGGPGYQFANEKNDLAFDKAGVVAMANAGPDTNGSQFFITFGPVGLAESDYTIFGQVISGMDVVNGITRRDPQTNPTFPGDAMASVTISTK
ncbi:MAG: peptidylprolyl isomerase [Anaerolineales bacterium]